ncbi:MAG: hypothetical protein MUE41_11225, partial [Gemmatimonadaceae bacterium]|nr:hypothetical protein [Gemmatimonadaceae bacterium]
MATAMLWRKQLREARGMLGQLVTIAAVAAVGIGVLSSSVGTLRALRAATTEFYRTARFAD